MCLFVPHRLPDGSYVPENERLGETEGHCPSRDNKAVQRNPQRHPVWEPAESRPEIRWAARFPADELAILMIS